MDFHYSGVPLHSCFWLHLSQTYKWSIDGVEEQDNTSAARTETVEHVLLHYTAYEKNERSELKEKLLNRVLQRWRVYIYTILQTPLSSTTYIYTSEQLKIKALLKGKAEAVWQGWDLIS